MLGIFYLKEGGSKYIRNADNNQSATVSYNEEKFKMTANSREDVVLTEIK
jgi:hypothetical protein